MDSGATKTIGLAAITTLIAIFVARAGGSTGMFGEAGGTLAGDSVASSNQRDSSTGPRWLNDANVLSLLSVMNSRQIVAADAELSGWHSDTVRAFAASMAREHAGLQRSADSVSEKLRLFPVAPALAEQARAAFQAQFDSIVGKRTTTLDRAYVAQQVASHKMMAEYVDQLSAVAVRPEVQALLSSVSARVASQLTRAQTMQSMFAVSDSIAADSLARRAERRSRAGLNR